MHRSILIENILFSENCDLKARTFEHYLRWFYLGQVDFSKYQPLLKRTYSAYLIWIGFSHMT